MRRRAGARRSGPEPPAGGSPSRPRAFPSRRVSSEGDSPPPPAPDGFEGREPVGRAEPGGPVVAGGGEADQLAGAVRGLFFDGAAGDARRTVERLAAGPVGAAGDVVQVFRGRGHVRVQRARRGRRRRRRRPRARTPRRSAARRGWCRRACTSAARVWFCLPCSWFRIPGWSSRRRPRRCRGRRRRTRRRPPSPWSSRPRTSPAATAASWGRGRSCCSRHPRPRHRSRPSRPPRCSPAPSFSRVPPTATTCGEAAGNSTAPAPESQSR